jgi:Mrp family chromosome partitioning ATPase
MQRQAIGKTLCQIGKTFLVLSGKGGVGKSTVATQLAGALAAKDKKVGILDIDFHGPSIPTMTGLTTHRALNHMGKILPAEIPPNLKIMSIGFLTEDHNQPIIWRGPMKMGAIQQLLADVEWGELDYLIVDCPPGTGDEPLSIAQTIPNADGAIIVTTPQKVALADVRRSVTFCHELNLPITGLIENMSGLYCPKCNEKINLFKSGGGKALAEEMNIKFLGEIPIHPEMVDLCDRGTGVLEQDANNPVVKALNKISEELIKVEPQKAKANLA